MKFVATPSAGQQPRQPAAEKIHRQAAQEGRALAQPGETDGHIEGRSPRPGIEGEAAAVVGGDEEIEQRLARDQDHLAAILAGSLNSTSRSRAKEASSGRAAPPMARASLPMVPALICTGDSPWRSSPATFSAVRARIRWRTSAGEGAVDDRRLEIDDRDGGHHGLGQARRRLLDPFLEMSAEIAPGIGRLPDPRRILAGGDQLLLQHIDRGGADELLGWRRNAETGMEPRAPALPVRPA